MPRYLFFPLFALAAALVAGGGAPVHAAPSPPASPSATPDAAARDDSRDAGSIDGVVTGVTYAPGKSKMTVRSGSTSYELLVLAGTNVMGPTHDFAVDVRVGSRVSVSASKVGATYTAQTIRVLPQTMRALH